MEILEMSYTIKPGDTLYNLVKKQKPNLNADQIWAKIKDIANKNSESIYTKNGVSWKKGTDYRLKEGKTIEGLDNDAASGQGSVFEMDNNKSMADNFDNWQIDVEQNKKPNDFTFAKDYFDIKNKCGAETAKAYYKEQLGKFAQSQIDQADSAPTGGKKDGKISFEEYKKQMTNITDGIDKKSNIPTESLTEEMIKAIKNDFAEKDLNGDGYIDKNEESALLATIDGSNSENKSDGKITEKEFRMFQDKRNNKASFNEAYKFLFGVDGTVAGKEAGKTNNAGTATAQTPVTADYLGTYNPMNNKAFKTGLLVNTGISIASIFFGLLGKY